MLNIKVKEYLDSLEKGLKFIESSYYLQHISLRIIDLIDASKSSRQVSENKAEEFAFYLEDDNPTRYTDWGTYYEPMHIFTDTNGQDNEYPSIKEIDQNMIEYWTIRAKESKNPILLARYADLVVDFSLIILGKNAAIDLFHTVIESNIKICEKSLAIPSVCIARAKRALDLSIKIADQGRIRKAKSTIIKLEKNIARSDSQGLYGFAFELLLLDSSKKVTLGDNEINELICEAEDRLKRVASNPTLVGDTVPVLADWYSRKKDEENLMRVLNAFENSVKMNEQSYSNASSKRFDFVSMQMTYENYSDRFPKAKKASQRVLLDIEQLHFDDGLSAKSTFVTKADKKDIDDQLKAIFGENKNDNLEIVMYKIAIAHLPSKIISMNLPNVNSSKYPVRFLPPLKLLSDESIPIVKFSSVKEDCDDNLKSYASQHLALMQSGLLLPFTMGELRKRFTKDEVIDYFKKSTVFENENEIYFERAISAYWDKDDFASLHFFNPFIETGIRELVKICGCSVWKQDKSKVLERLSLEALLNDVEIERCFDVNTLFYFRWILSKKLDFNLHGDLVHGSEKNDYFLRDASDMLFHILILLSIFTKNDSK